MSAVAVTQYIDVDASACPPRGIARARLYAFVHVIVACVSDANVLALLSLPVQALCASRV